MIGLWWRAVRSRPLGTVVLLLLAATAVATAALGPLLVRAMEQSALADAVSDAGAGSTLVRVSLPLERNEAYEQARTQVQVPFERLDQGPDGDLWRAPDLLVASRENISWTASAGPGDRSVTRAYAAEQGCAGFVLVAGRCPAFPGETLVSAADAERLEFGPDDTVRFRLPDSPTRSLKVVGTYDAERSLPGRLVRPGSAEAGGGDQTVNADGDYSGEQAGVQGAPTGDPLVVTAGQLSALRLPVTVSANLLLGDLVAVDEVPAARATLTSVAALAADGVPGRTLFFDSDLGVVLDRAARLSADAAVVIGVTVVQAFALAFFALAIVLQRVGRARAAEWGVGRLRGVDRRRWFASILVEPAVPLLLGLPLGWALAGQVGRWAVDTQLRPGTAVEPTRGPVLVAAAAAFLAAAVALTLVALAAIRRPTVELIQQTAERRRLSRLALVAQAGLVLLAGAAVYQLQAEDSLTVGRSRLGLLAPALLALALAVLAVRAGVLAVRWVGRRPPRSRVGLVVGRQIGRTPSSLNPVVVIAAGLALTVFAGQVLALSTRNQELRARANVGAGTVLQVAPERGVDLMTAVAAADPGGRQAMAVKEIASSSSSGTSRIVAVDAGRFDAVTSWSPAWSDVPDVGLGLRAGDGPSLPLRGTTIALDLRELQVSRRAGNDPYTGQPITGVELTAPRLTLVYARPGGWADVEFGDLTKDATSTTLTGRLSGCTVGCRLIGLIAQADYGVSFTLSFTLAGVTTDDQPAADAATALQAAGWYQPVGDPSMPDTAATATGVPAADGLEVAMSSEYGDEFAFLRPPDSATPWPALLGPRVPKIPVMGRDGVVVGNGLDAQAVILRPIGTATVLPRSLTDGVLVDLRNADFSADPRQTNGAIDEVWLAVDAPASVEQALGEAGLQILSRETLADTRDTLDRQPTTRAAAVAVVLGYAALVLTLLTLLASRLADAGRRRRGWRALREAGLRRRTVWWLAAVEIAVPAVVAVVVGAAAGLVTLTLAAPRLPLVDLAVPGPPLDLGLAWTPVLTAAAVTTALILLVAVVVATVETWHQEAR